MARGYRRLAAASTISIVVLANNHRSLCSCDAFIAPCSWLVTAPEKPRLFAPPSSSFRRIGLLPAVNRHLDGLFIRHRSHSTSVTTKATTLMTMADGSSSSEDLGVENVVIIGSGPAVRRLVSMKNNVHNFPSSLVDISKHPRRTTAVYVPVYTKQLIGRRAFFLSTRRSETRISCFLTTTLYCCS